MRELAGNVAVVTGGASGIGRALAEGFCREGMHVAIGDVEEPALTQAVSSLGREGASVIGVRADVTRAADVEALRDQALSAFGAVHVVCNCTPSGRPEGVHAALTNRPIPIEPLNARVLRACQEKKGMIPNGSPYLFRDVTGVAGRAWRHPAMQSGT